MRGFHLNDPTGFWVEDGLQDQGREHCPLQLSSPEITVARPRVVATEEIRSRHRFRAILEGELTGCADGLVN